MAPATSGRKCGQNTEEEGCGSWSGTRNVHQATTRLPLSPSPANGTGPQSTGSRADTQGTCCNVLLCLSTAKYPLILHDKDPAAALPLKILRKYPHTPFLPHLLRTNSWFPPGSLISPRVCFFLLECNHLSLNVGLLFFLIKKFSPY